MAAPENNNDVFLLPDEEFVPPSYAPVSFENLDQDTNYLVRMTTHDLTFMDLLLQTTHAQNWKTDTTVRPVVMATRKFKRIFSVQILMDQGAVVEDEEDLEEDEDGNMPLLLADVEEHEGEVVTFDEFNDILEDHSNSDRLFNKLEFAKDANNRLVPQEWNIYDYPYIYPVDKDSIRMEIDKESYGYVFFKKVEEEPAAVAADAVAAAAGGRRKTRRTRRRSSRRQRRTRRRSSRRQRR